jgi:hypothetical protein
MLYFIIIFITTRILSAFKSLPPPPPPLVGDLCCCSVRPSSRILSGRRSPSRGQQTIEVKRPESRDPRVSLATISGGLTTERSRATESESCRRYRKINTSHLFFSASKKEGKKEGKASHGRRGKIDDGGCCAALKRTSILPVKDKDLAKKRKPE